MLFESLRRLVSRKRVKNTRRKTFVPQVDILEDRRLLAAVTRFVDDSYHPGQLNSTHFNTIQEAVDAAKPGDTVRVLPGLYNEAVVVNKKLTLTGAFAASVPGPHNPSVNPSRASIVDPLGPGVAFSLTANDIVLQGFTVENADADTDSIGVSVLGTTGDKIIANVIQDNTTGIYLNSNTSTSNNGGRTLTVVSGNTLLNNNADGAGAGNGIYSDAGLRNATIAGNRFTGHLNASIILVGGPDPSTSHTKVTIAGNVLGKPVRPGHTPDASQMDAPIILANTSNSVVSGNVSYNSAGSGIALVGGDDHVKIVGNYLTGGAFTGINLAFFIGSYNVEVPNSNIDVIGNTVTYYGDSGIRLRDGVTNVLVRGNVLLYNGTGGFEETGDGISLEDAHNSRIEANVVKFNARNGINVDAASDGNLIQSNVSVSNNTRGEPENFDYLDTSVGTGTAGTANTYKNNRGRTESPTGLIKFHI